MKVLKYLVVAVSVSLLLGAPSLWAAGPPYTEASRGGSTTPDPSGLGHASSAATDNPATGALSANASSSEELPIGVALGIGTSSATAGGAQIVKQTVGPGTYVVTSTFTGLHGSTATSTPLASVQPDLSSVCGLGECGVGESASESASLSLLVLRFDGTCCINGSNVVGGESKSVPSSPSTVVLTGTVTVPSGESGILEVDAGLEVLASTMGGGDVVNSSTASASASGVVSDITISP